MKFAEETVVSLGKKFEAIADCLTEKGRRLWSASEALSYGHGGVSLVNKATNISRTTIHQGIKEIQNKSRKTKQGIRKKGGGRKKAKDIQPKLLSDLNKLIEPSSRGDPESPLRWTCKSTRNLAKELKMSGHKISYVTVATLLHELDYSLQANKKTLEGFQHADRDLQFKYINKSVLNLHERGRPTISVDTKKLKTPQNFKNAVSYRSSSSIRYDRCVFHCRILVKVYLIKSPQRLL